MAVRAIAPADRGLPVLAALVLAVAGGAPACGGDDTCQDLHTFQDYGRTESCWDPPFYYCAQGGAAVVTVACKPDRSVCCEFGSSCVHCGWEVVPPDQHATLTPAAPECQPSAMPDIHASFCWDGLELPPELADRSGR